MVWMMHSPNIFILSLVLIILTGTWLTSAKGNAVSESARERNKARFKQLLTEAIAEEDDLSDDDSEEYTDYVSKYDKLNKYLGDNKFGKSQFKRKYRAFKNNKERINKLNANPNKRRVTSHGRVFEESYRIGKFTDMDIEERKAFLQNEAGAGKRRSLLTSGCTSVPPNYFSANNAASTNFDGYTHCGEIKDQGELHTCWAFASTGQLQCNNNWQRNENKVFSEKYATDCSTAAEGKVTSGHHTALTGWYTNNGACDNYYKQYDQFDTTDIDNDCNCLNDKVYGQCYELSTLNNYLQIANAAATGYSWMFAIYVTNDFFDFHTTWYGCEGKRKLFGHGMVLIGQWHGDLTAIRNSWGSNWADSGMAWFHRDVWSSCAYQPTLQMTMTYLPVTPTPTLPLTPVRGSNVVAPGAPNNDYFFKDDDEHDNNDKILNNYPLPIDNNNYNYNNNFLTYIAFGLLIGVCFTLCIYCRQQTQQTKVKYVPVSPEI